MNQGVSCQWTRKQLQLKYFSSSWETADSSMQCVQESEKLHPSQQDPAHDVLNINNGGGARNSADVHGEDVSGEEGGLMAGFIELVGIRNRCAQCSRQKSQAHLRGVENI